MKGIAFILFIIVIVLLAMTNPGTDDFKSFLESKIESENSSGTGIEEVLRDIFSGPASDIIAQNTTRENYYIWSVYTIQLNGKANRYLGIATKFFPLEQELLTTE